MRHLRFLVAAALLATATAAFSEGNGDRKPPPPPPEAIDACLGLQNYSSCTFRVDTHDLNGTCHLTPDAVLACIPVRRPPGAPGGATN